LILRRLNPGTRIFGTIYCLRSGLSASAELAGESLNRFEQDLLALGREILERDFTEIRPVPLDICPHCDFLPLCARYWQRQGLSEISDGPLSEDGC
jgi:hypothetical protein